MECEYLRFGWLMQLDHCEAALRAQLLNSLQHLARAPDLLRAQRVQRVRIASQRHLRGRHSRYSCNYTHNHPPYNKRPTLSYQRTGVPPFVCCLILARPSIFVIAIDASLLVSYANGQVAGTLDIFILRTAFTAAVERHLQDLAGESREPESFSRQVNYRIAQRLGLGPLSLPSIAGELGLSSRSFQRRLAEERTTFRRLVREHRCSIAEALMKNRSTTVTSVAHIVGYAETAVLSRAFKSWTGSSPRSFARATRAQG
jgi:AraC-like DNA-binding protein